jgi:ABC-type uncharacterized transport system auxiliary subunit
MDTPAISGSPIQSNQESLRVARFQAVTPLRQDGIVTYQEGFALVQFAQDACWESSPSDMVGERLVEAFQVAQLFSRVDTHPSRAPADYLVRGRILRFNQLQTGHGLYGEVGLAVEFIDQENGAILWSTIIRAREKAEGDDMEAAVHAVGEALQQCIRQIVQQVKQIKAYHGSVQ